MAKVRKQSTSLPSPTPTAPASEAPDTAAITGTVGWPITLLPPELLARFAKMPRLQPPQLPDGLRAKLSRKFVPEGVRQHIPTDRIDRANAAPQRIAEALETIAAQLTPKPAQEGKSKGDTAKRKTGQTGSKRGQKPRITEEGIKHGQKTFRTMLREHPSWADNKSAAAKRVLEIEEFKDPKTGELLDWQTVKHWITEPVLEQRQRALEKREKRRRR